MLSAKCAENHWGWWTGGLYCEVCIGIMLEFFSSLLCVTARLSGVSLTLIIVCAHLPQFPVWIQYLLSQLESSGMHRIQLMGCRKYSVACRQRKWGKMSSCIFLKLLFIQRNYYGNVCVWNSNFLYSLHTAGICCNSRVFLHYFMIPSIS